MQSRTPTHASRMLAIFGRDLPHTPPITSNTWQSSDHIKPNPTHNLSAPDRRPSGAPCHPQPIAPSSDAPPIPASSDIGRRSALRVSASRWRCPWLGKQNELHAARAWHGPGPPRDRAYDDATWYLRAEPEMRRRIHWQQSRSRSAPPPSRFGQ